MGGRGSGKPVAKVTTSIAGNLFFLALCVSVFLSALAVVYSSFEARQATQKLEDLRKQSSGLQVRSGQYLLEKGTWAAYARVEEIAINKLNMQQPDSSKTVLVKRR